MDINQASALTSSAVTAAIPLMFAGAGELVAEKSGVLNLGVEGMMLMGAVSGYAVTAITGNPWLGVLAAIGAGLAMSLLFAFLTLTMLANQVATGLSLTIFGIGLSAYVGKPYTSAAVRATIDTWTIPGLSKIPVLGPALFSLTPLDYLAFLMFAVIGWFLYRTRAGLVLRSVGESPQVAHSVGFPVVGVRYGAVAFGGGMGRARGRLLLDRQSAPVAGKPDLGTRLDRARAGRVRDVAPGPSADRRAAVRRRHGAAVLRAGDRRAGADAVSRDAAVRRDRRRAGADFAQSEHDPAERTGIAG
ncbi:ABC-type uncharacterized transport system permease subunit [Paraburkholderia bryophila]|uniref:ABC-type uncharacterized transport system permease subunit n=1 Tax=Paraburkholderia bryophila TaxID=420952 RepID=A0A7Z0B5G2_9BURK|nr:ABC-type uncharacterized transport system permease subunit [Paraburkholderia bryophila]